MDGKKVTIVGIVAILIGLLVGWLFWGSQAKDLQAELAKLKAQAQAAAQQEAATAAKLSQLETQLKALMAELEKEKAAREALQAKAAKGKK
jgi:Tfp pilus assembly protein PilO